MMFQRVSDRNPTAGPPRGSKNGNAVAGVTARNGAKKIGSGKRTAQRNTANRPILASEMTAVLDREGMVLCVLAGRAEARSFLRGGCA